MSEIQQAINIPESTLKKILVQMQQEKTLFVETKKGRGGYTKIATRKSIAVTTLKQKEELFNHYKTVLEKYFPATGILLKELQTIVNHRKLSVAKEKLILSNSS